MGRGLSETGDSEAGGLEMPGPVVDGFEKDDNEVGAVKAHFDETAEGRVVEEAVVDGLFHFWAFLFQMA